MGRCSPLNGLQLIKRFIPVSFFFFFSCKLSSAESNYDVGNHELLAIKLALEEWRHWLEGVKHPFIVWMDHKNLAYIQKAKQLNSQQANKISFFGGFNFTITFRPGTRNIKPESLSHQFTADATSEPYFILPSSCIVTSVPLERVPCLPGPATSLIQVIAHLILYLLLTWMSFSGCTQPDLPVTRE